VLRLSPSLFLFRLSETLCAVLRGLGGTGWVGGGLRADNCSQGCSALPAGDCLGSEGGRAHGWGAVAGSWGSLCVPFSPSRAENVSPVEGERC